MRNRYIVILIVSAAALFLASCSTPIERKVQEEPDTAVVQEEMPPVDSPDPAGSDHLPKPGNDNSEIVSLHDEQGNLVETRTFLQDALIQSIVVTTHSDGSKKGLVYLKSGEQKIMDNKHVAAALIKSGAELGKLIGLKAIEPEVSDQASLAENTVAVVKHIPAEQTPLKASEPVQAIKEPEPKTEDRPAVSDRPENKKPAEDVRLRQTQKELAGWLPSGDQD